MSDSGPSAPTPASPPPGRGARYQRSIGGMAGALIVTLLAVTAFVGFRALNRDPLEVTQEPVDYLPVVAQLQSEGREPVYPSRLPEGWVATSVDLRQGATPSWGLGTVTDADTFVGIRHGGDTLEGLLRTYVDENPTEGATATVETEVATEWRTFSDDGGDRAYAAEVGALPLLVYGTADDEDLRTMLALLTTAPVEASGAGPGEEPSGSEGAETDPVAPGRATRALERAVTRLGRQPRVGFRHRGTLDGSPLIATAGGYLADSGDWSARTRITDPVSGDATLVTRYVDGKGWLRIATGEDAPTRCWVPVSDSQAPAGVVALTPGPPAYLAMAIDLEATGFAPGSSTEIVGTVGMFTVARLLPEPLLAQMDLDRLTYDQERVPARITLRQGRLHRVQVSGVDLLEIVWRVSGQPADDVTGYLSRSADVVEYRPTSTVRSVVPPAPDQVGAGAEDCPA